MLSKTDENSDFDKDRQVEGCCEGIYTGCWVGPLLILFGGQKASELKPDTEQKPAMWGLKEECPRDKKARTKV